MKTRNSVTHAKPEVPVALIVFTVAYFAATSLSAILNNNKALAPYVLTLVVLAVLIYMVHLRTNFSGKVLWCLSVWGLLHLCGGLVQIPAFWPHNSPSNVLYSLWFIPERLRYDHVVHAFGFGITVQLCWELLGSTIQHRYGIRLTPSLGLVAVCVAAGMGFGAVNEVVEFAATHMLTHVDAGGYLNTSWDLVYNTVGTLLAGIIIGYGPRGRKPV